MAGATAYGALPSATRIHASLASLSIACVTVSGSVLSLLLVSGPGIGPRLPTEASSRPS